MDRAAEREVMVLHDPAASSVEPTRGPRVALLLLSSLAMTAVGMGALTGVLLGSLLTPADNPALEGLWLTPPERVTSPSGTADGVPAQQDGPPVAAGPASPGDGSDAQPTLAGDRADEDGREPAGTSAPALPTAAPGSGSTADVRTAAVTGPDGGGISAVLEDRGVLTDAADDPGADSGSRADGGPAAEEEEAEAPDEHAEPDADEPDADEPDEPDELDEPEPDWDEPDWDDEPDDDADEPDDDEPDDDDADDDDEADDDPEADEALEP